MDTLLKKSQPEKLLLAAFAACSLYLLNPKRAMKRIPSRSMEVDSESAKQLIDSSLGELRGVGKN